jgi:hypothetical protein
MPSYLVVANQTLGGARLASAVRERMRAGDCRFPEAKEGRHYVEV